MESFVSGEAEATGGSQSDRTPYADEMRTLPLADGLSPKPTSSQRVKYYAVGP